MRDKGLFLTGSQLALDGWCHFYEIQVHPTKQLLRLGRSAQFGFDQVVQFEGVLRNNVQ